MSAHDLDAVLAFFKSFTTAEEETWAFGLREDKDFMDKCMQGRVVNNFFEGRAGNFIEQLDFEEEPDAAWFEKHRARSVGPRVAYALQAVTVGEEPMTMIYADDYEKKFAGMRNRFAVAEVDGSLKIVARHRMCGACKGTSVDQVTTANCCECNSRERGWRFAGGRDLNTPKSTGNVRRLTEPTDDYEKMFYLDVLA